MVLKFLLLLFPAILLYIPMAFYKKTGNCMTAFYYRMAFSENTRKFYMLTLLIMLLLFHYLHHSVMNDIVTLIPSTALSMCLFSYRLTDSMFYLIRSRLRMFVAMLLAMILATVVLPVPLCAANATPVPSTSNVAECNTKALCNGSHSASLRKVAINFI